MRNIPEHYRPWVGDTEYKRDVIIDRAGFMSPEATHFMYYENEELPPFYRVGYIARERAQRFYQQGYEPIISIMPFAEMTVRQMVALSETGAIHISRGCLVGPYITSRGLQEGISIYQRGVNHERS